MGTLAALSPGLVIDTSQGRGVWGTPGGNVRLSANPAEPGYPCYVSVLGELAWMPPRGELTPVYPMSAALPSGGPIPAAAPPGRSPRADPQPRSAIRGLASIHANPTRTEGIL